MSEDQEKARLETRMRKEWFPVVKDAGRIESIGGAFYFFGTELDCLRLLARYRGCKSARQGFSTNMGTHYFSLEVGTPSSCVVERKMTDAEARRVFDKVAAETNDPDARANIELCREYFTNPDFRRAMEGMVATANGL